MPFETSAGFPQTNQRIVDRLSWGFCTLRRLQKQAATYTGLATTRLCCAFRFSQPLDALIPPATSPALFHAGSTLGFSLTEVFPPR
jgi:hypothetical protein